MGEHSEKNIPKLRCKVIARDGRDQYLVERDDGVKENVTSRGIRFQPGDRGILEVFDGKLSLLRDRDTNRHKA